MLLIWLFLTNLKKQNQKNPQTQNKKIKNKPKPQLCY